MNKPRVVSWLGLWGRRVALVAVLVAATAGSAGADERGAARELGRIRHEPALLNQFLWDLPKGGDLHMHLTGAVYAENIVRYGASSGDCVDVFTFVSSPPPCTFGQRPISDALTDNNFQNMLMRAWSMKGFVPGVESGHDHFFATFSKFGAALSGHHGDALATIARQARAQHVEYLEVLETMGFAQVAALARQVGFTRDFAVLRRRLLAAGIRRLVPVVRHGLDELLAQEHRADPSPTPVIRFDVQVLRANLPAVVFAQMLLGFELMRSDHRWVGINLVQPEDDITALQDYMLQMRMLHYLRGAYPVGHITLHAGELSPGLAPPQDLRFHIRAAVEVGDAERIGHGVDIRSERNPLGLLREMARKRILVEVPLVSNCQILLVCGPSHPIDLYIRFGVPVALATDDEGVSRTDLTQQYLLAVTRHGLGYLELKKISFDSLRYSFLPSGIKHRLMGRLARAFARFEARYPSPR